MPAPVSMPVMTDKDAESIGFASFNTCPTLCVDVPDGGFTISAKTSEGKRVTFYFGPYKNGGPPQMIDVVYHDNGTTRTNGRNVLPTFDVVAMGKGGNHLFHGATATPNGEDKVGILCVLMEGKKGGEAPATPD